MIAETETILIIWGTNLIRWTSDEDDDDDDVDDDNDVFPHSYT